jgi:hypothetical protein
LTADPAIPFEAIFPAEGVGSSSTSSKDASKMGIAAISCVRSNVTLREDFLARRLSLLLSNRRIDGPGVIAVLLNKNFSGVPPKAVCVL